MQRLQLENLLAFKVHELVNSKVQIKDITKDKENGQTKERNKVFIEGKEVKEEQNQLELSITRIDRKEMKCRPKLGPTNIESLHIKMEDIGLKQLVIILYCESPKRSNFGESKMKNWIKLSI